MCISEAPTCWWWTPSCLPEPAVRRCLKYQTFFLLFSLKPTLSCSFFQCFRFWRENSSFCVPLSQMSHSSEPVTTFGLGLAGCGSPRQRRLRFSASHTFTGLSHPHSLAGSFFFFFAQATLSLLFPFLFILSGEDKGDIFSVKRSVKFPA